MIKGKDLVLVSGDFARYPSSFEHLMRRFAPANRLIWVETIGMRRPTLSLFDLKRAVGKLARLGKAKTSVARQDLPEGVSVITPTMLPFHDVAWVKKRNEARLADATNAEIQRRGFKDFALVTTVPLAAGLGQKIGASFVAYYCMDDWSLWPGLLKEAIPVWERRLLEEARLTVTTSEELKNTKSLPGKPAEVLPHGVDVKHFAQAKKAPGPVRLISYFGLFDARTDQTILANVAKARPEVTVEIIGPVQVDASMLRSLPNVVFRGPVSYAELPAALRDSDLLLLPYRLDRLSKSINPLKIRECLATEKAILTMSLKELSDLPGLIQAKTPAEFVELAVSIIDGKLERPAPASQAWLRDSSWEARAEKFSGWLEPLFPGARP